MSGFFDNGDGTSSFLFANSVTEACQYVGRLIDDKEAAATATAAGSSSATRKLVGRTVADVERDLIIDTLRHCVGNRTHAANILGISIRTLRNKLKQYTGEGVSVPMPGELDRAAL